MNEMLMDEYCHLSGKPIFISGTDLLKKDFSGNVILHNTMRFDVQLSHVQPMLDNCDFDKTELVNAIRKAIVQTVEDVVGSGLDGLSIPGGASVVPVLKSKMLHRETIHFDLS
jgi:hypothetical protein